MQIKNSELSYGLVAILFHWAVAIGFLAAYASVYYRQWFTEAETDANMTALHLHLSFGVSIAVLVLLRIIWKLRNPTPRHAPGAAWEHLAAHWAHYLLYAVMIIMPITGYLGTGLVTDFFFLFEIPRFADTWLFAIVVEGWWGLTFEEFEAPIDFIHKRGGEYLVWVLILAHAAAALYHHFVRGDFVLRRMLKPGVSE